MSDLSIYYGGGSGGFIALHSLLLTDNYFCSLTGINFINDSNFLINFNHIKNKQWTANLNVGEKDWKSTEIWPDNVRTVTASSTRSKVYFYCNEFEEPVIGKSVLIYTDIKSQLEICKLKKAYWYSNTIYPHISFWQSSYYNIKADSWPDVTLATDFFDLPEYQRSELLAIMPTDNKVTVKSTPKEVITENILANAKTISNGLVVEDKVADFYEIADYRVLLQDLVNTNGKILLDALGIQHTADHKILFDKWRSLHSLEFLESIGILNDISG
jgi:hypothetical protein